MIQRCAIVALVSLSFATTARAVELRVHWDFHGQPAATNAAKLTFRSLMSPPQTVELMLPFGATSAEVPPGQWSLDLENPDWWHARQYLQVTEATSDLTIPLWRSATVTGNPTLTGGSAPKDVTVRFAGSKDDVQGQTTCPVVDRHFRCAVPAGLLDLRVRAKGCIAHYAWGKTLTPGGALDLGEVVFEQGAAITGRVVLGRGVKAALTAVRVRAFPAGSAADKIRLQQFVATPEARGFFHLDGVPPGEYMIRADGTERVTSPSVGVTVVGTAEAELREPLLADVPRTLTVEVTPRLNLDQKPWIVTLDRDVARHYGETVAQGALDQDGRWQSHLQPGKYSMRISSLDGAVWASRDVDLGSDEHIFMLIATRTIRGKILLGKKPLAAKLIFGGEFGTPRVPVKSDEDGHFEVHLPQTDAASWDVTVDAAAPRVKRTLRAEIPTDDRELTLQLRETVVIGTVIDQAGAPARDVTVNMSGEHELIQVDADSAGAFGFHGVEPGTYTVQAEGYLLESDALELSVPKDGAPDELRLVVKPVRKVVGRVLSNLGPVAGARVTIAPVDVPALMNSTRETNERGEFSATAPLNCQRVDVYVSPPGFSFRAFRTTLRDDGALTIPVDQRGGTLIVRWPKASASPLLFHTGALIWPDMLVDEWTGRKTSTKDRAEIVSAPLDPGVYSLCPAAPAKELPAKRLAGADPRCVEVFLPPFGEATLAEP